MGMLTYSGNSGLEREEEIVVSCLSYVVWTSYADGWGQITENYVSRDSSKKKEDKMI